MHLDAHAARYRHAFLSRFFSRSLDARSSEVFFYSSKWTFEWKEKTEEREHRATLLIFWTAHSLDLDFETSAKAESLHHMRRCRFWVIRASRKDIACCYGFFFEYLRATEVEFSPEEKQKGGRKYLWKFLFDERPCWWLLYVFESGHRREGVIFERLSWAKRRRKEHVMAQLLILNASHSHMNPVFESLES